MVQVISQTLTCGKELIYSETCTTDRTPRCLVLHGAGQGDIARLNIFRKQLAESGLGNVAFDFSGHGKSSAVELGSLHKRVFEAEKSLQMLTSRHGRVLIAFSMSGEIAIRLASNLEHRISDLVLFAPAIYHRDAFSVPFGPKFTEAIRQPYSWRESDALECLDRFQGRLLLMIPENDEVIPKEVSTLIFNHATSAESRLTIILPSRHHMVGAQMAADPNFSHECVRTILKYITND